MNLPKLLPATTPQLVTRTSMPTLTITGMPDPLYQRLKQRAAEHGRSLNCEILVALEQSITATSPDTQALLARIDALRSALRVPPLTDAGLLAAKSRGRL